MHPNEGIYKESGRQCVEGTLPPSAAVLPFLAQRPPAKYIVSAGRLPLSCSMFLEEVPA